ncbi:unnamed protein product [Prunus brigantina]
MRLDFDVDEFRQHLATVLEVAIEGSDPGWTGYVWAGLNCQQLQLLSFSCESIPKFNFGRALIYFKLCEASEWAELRLLQSEGAEVAVLEDSVC